MAEIHMHALSCGSIELDKSLFVANTQKGTRIDSPVSAWLIEHPKGNVLFDTGCHPDTMRDPEGRWGGLFRSMQPHLGEGDDVVSQLARVGLRPDDVAIVINSHLHMDHCGGNEFFPRATFYVQQDELEAARVNEGRGYFKSDWDHGLTYRAIEGDHDLFGDRTIEIARTDGHTVGHQSLIVRLPVAGTMLLTGDAANMLENLEHLLLARNIVDPEATMRSYHRLRGIKESERAIVVPGHDATFWRECVKHPPRYYE